LFHTLVLNFSRNKKILKEKADMSVKEVKVCKKIVSGAKQSDILSLIILSLIDYN
jgi:hypothetical protein